MIFLKFMVLCFIVFLCASPSSELVVFDPSKWLYRTRSKGLTSYSGLSVLLPLRGRLEHLSYNNSAGSTIDFVRSGTARAGEARPGAARCRRARRGLAQPEVAQC